MLKFKEPLWLLILIIILITLFVNLIMFFVELRFSHQITSIEVGALDSLSNMYQSVITILTVLLGFSSIITFVYSKKTAENSMHELVSSALEETCKKILSSKKYETIIEKFIIENVINKKVINKIIRDEINNVIVDLQEQINELKEQVDIHENKLNQDINSLRKEISGLEQ